MHDDTISAPQVPNSAAPNAVMDAPAIEKQGAPDFDKVNVRIPHTPSEKWKRSTLALPGLLASKALIHRPTALKYLSTDRLTTALPSFSITMSQNAP
jgi:hypothetical protein